MEIVSLIFGIIVIVLFFGLPLASIVWFLVSLIRFFMAPGSDGTLRKKRGRMLLISGITMVALVSAFLILVYLIMRQAVAHM